MTTFANIKLEELKTDCRFYTGYKPCHKNDGCPDCPHYEKRGDQILIIKLGAMGDVLRTKVILSELKKEHPESWIVWLTNKGSEVLVKDPLVDEVRTYTTEGLKALEGRHYKRLLCLDKDPHAVSLSAQLSADVKQGFAPTECNSITVWNEASLYALRLGLSDPLKFHENQKTVPEIVSEMCELNYSGEPYTLTIDDKWKELAENKIKETFACSKDKKKLPVIGINTGCGPVFATKAWPVHRIIEYIRLVANSMEARVVLLGGPREKHIHDRINEELKDLKGSALFDLGNDNPLDLFCALVGKCDLVVSADSLGMHIAIAQGRNVIAWFGSTCHQEVDLFGKGEKIVSDFPCSPCYLKSCPKPVFCMEAMKAETVHEATIREIGKLTNREV